MSSCTGNSTNNCCTDRTYISVYNHSRCSDQLSSCTVHSTKDSCTAKTCSNSTTTQFTQTNWTAWLSTCTNSQAIQFQFHIRNFLIVGFTITKLPHNY
ncbi:unnamed protein product [Paramecium sonneborni]|uniref:Uncharacterized protein n=1 Tax=Paramecium sonneborni TaxID=65129 RepID=A0A8S1RMD3_9CILI|nr:unnamed protein product [Paramecium sonneborni]